MMIPLTLIFIVCITGILTSSRHGDDIPQTTVEKKKKAKMNEKNMEEGKEGEKHEGRKEGRKVRR